MHAQPLILNILLQFSTTSVYIYVLLPNIYRTLDQKYKPIKYPKLT